MPRPPDFHDVDSTSRHGVGIVCVGGRKKLFRVKKGWDPGWKEQDKGVRKAGSRG